MLLNDGIQNIGKVERWFDWNDFTGSLVKPAALNERFEHAAAIWRVGNVRPGALFALGPLLLRVACGRLRDGLESLGLVTSAGTAITSATN